jgi:hypothetical protein
MMSLDAIPVVVAPVGTVTYAVVCLVSGSLTLDGERNPLPFSQAFVVVVDGDAPSCSNDIFRFNTA